MIAAAMDTAGYGEVMMEMGEWMREGDGALKDEERGS
jgi:hypothetical protein